MKYLGEIAMKIDGEEIIAIESDEGILCPSCWIQKTKDNTDDYTIYYYITNEQAMDFIGEDYEVCRECGFPIGGVLLSDLIYNGNNYEKNLLNTYR
ncbi:hypothetical protein ACFL6P_05720 [Candidatus Latescibacterota bacterium]